LHVHVLEPTVGSGSLLDALERAPDRAAEVHRAHRKEAGSRKAGKGPSGSGEGVSRHTDQDTIGGIATPQRVGAIGMVRISGPLAIPAASRLVRIGRLGGLEACQPRTLHLATLIDPGSGAELDKAMVVTMSSPSSYTGEDVVEISCHGNPVLLAEIIDNLVVSGARLAEPGEFTRRAYLNGRMDLLQVEAVAELISARTTRAIRHASRQLSGAFSLEVRDVRERLLDLIARLEVTLDFPDDE